MNRFLGAGGAEGGDPGRLSSGRAGEGVSRTGLETELTEFTEHPVPSKAESCMLSGKVSLEQTLSPVAWQQDSWRETGQ